MFRLNIHTLLNMKTIIAPVDFSDASINALSFAVELSKRSGAKLIAVNITPDDSPGKALNKLKQIGSDLGSTSATEFKFEPVVVSGDLTSAMKELISEHQPDLIVMGTKGASGLKRILIGSNTVNVLANTTVPVLVVPEVARFESFVRKGKNRIVLATDLEAMEDDNALNILEDIALLMIEPKIRVMNVRPGKTQLDYLKGLERSALVSRFSPEIETQRITVFSDNILSGISYYLSENRDTGLVVMVARDSGNLIQRHYTREMASHTDFPLLVVHDAKR